MSLQHLLNEIRTCKICERSKNIASLPHPARPIVRMKSSAKILIVGQAPGNLAHQRGLPFDDPSGQKLRTWMGVSREEFYDDSQIAFAPMGFCFPGYGSNGSDLPPRKECAPLWQEKLLGKLPLIEIILLIGIYAMRWYLEPEKTQTVTDIVRGGARFLTKPKGSLAIPLPHPSWRNSRWMHLNPWFKEEIIPDLQKQVRKRLSKTPVFQKSH